MPLTLLPQRPVTRTDLSLLLCVFILIVLSISPAVARSVENDTLHERALSMYEKYRKKFPQVEEIPAKAALALLSDKNVIFVDVREAEEQEVSMIPGAITQKYYLQHSKQYRHKEIITYCTIGYRSGKFAIKMQKEGLRVRNLRAGLLGWVHAHGSLENSHGPTQLLHVYGRRWDLAPAWIETIYH